MTPELLEIHIPRESIILPWLPRDTGVQAWRLLCPPVSGRVGAWMALEGKPECEHCSRRVSSNRDSSPRLCVLSTAARPAPACPLSLLSNQRLSPAIRSSCKKQPSSHIQWLKQNEQERDHGRQRDKKKTLEGHTKHVCMTLWIGNCKDSGSF